MPLVKLYFKAGEPYCEMIRNVLTYNKVQFEMIEVSVSKEAQKELKEVSGQDQVPVMIIDNKVYVGFDFKLIKNALGLSKNPEAKNEQS